MKLHLRWRVHTLRRLWGDLWSFALFAAGGAMALILGWVVACVWLPGASMLVSGALLQMAGVGTVALGIHQVRKQFDQPGITDRIKSIGRHLLTLFKRRPPAVEITVHMPMSMGFTSTLQVDPGPTLEERVELLEKAVREATGEARRELTAAVRGEKEQRESDIGEVRQRIENLALGGLRLEAVGAGWIVLGIALATWM